MICDALLAERDAEIALSPGFRWGATLLPGSAPSRVEDIYNATAITYPQVYRITMTGARLKEILEDVADNLFNPDPYYQQGGDMVRCGGLGYTIDIGKPIGSRISAMTHIKSGKPIEPRRTMSSPVGRASTKAPRARRCGNWSRNTSLARKSCGSHPTRA